MVKVFYDAVFRLLPRQGISALLFCSLLPAVPLPAAAIEVHPFYSRHQNPLVQVFGFPGAEGGALVPAGRWEGRLVFDLANDSRFFENERERLSLDGETYRSVVALRYGVREGVEIGADIPWVAHSGGVLDGFIEGFHDLFGFTNGNRDEVEEYRLDYRYVREGEPLVALDESTSGPGDLQLFTALRLYGGEGERSRSAALRLGLKLPTGDSERLLGSGGTDLSLRLAATDPATLSSLKVTVYGSAGVVYLGEGDVLEDLQRRWVGFGSLGFGWAPLDWMAAKAQVDFRSSVFRDSGFKAVDSWATQLVGGFTFALPGDVLFDMGISENILVEASPDVTFHLALRRRF